MSVAIYLSEPVMAGSTALFTVTLKDALTGREVGQLQLRLGPDGQREYRRLDGSAFPAEWTYDAVLASACGRGQGQE
jgi:hypothetical protein